MALRVFSFDPTADDNLSRVRGIGRYLQIMKENMEGDFTFTNELRLIPKDSIFINPFFNFLQPPVSVKRLAKKQIAVIHDLIPLKYPTHFPKGLKGNINMFLNTFFFSNYDLIVANSLATKKDVIEMLNIPEDKVKIAYPTLPSLFWEKPQQTNFDRPANKYCLYVGDATWNKNLVNLAKAIKKINVTCVFVGKVFSKESREQARKIDNLWLLDFQDFLRETDGDKRFIFLEFVDDYRLINLYNQAAVNILISKDEGFGFSYLEAASQATPSVISDIPALREISNGKGVIKCRPDNPVSIANAIGELYFYPDRRITLGIEAQRQSQLYSRRKFREDWMKFVLSI